MGIGVCLAGTYQTVPESDTGGGYWASTRPLAFPSFTPRGSARVLPFPALQARYGVYLPSHRPPLRHPRHPPSSNRCYIQRQELPSRCKPSPALHAGRLLNIPLPPSPLSSAACSSLQRHPKRQYKRRLAKCPLFVLKLESLAAIPSNRSRVISPS